MSRSKPPTDVPAEEAQPPSLAEDREELVNNLALLVVRQHRRLTNQAASAAPQPSPSDGDAADRS